MIGTTISHYRIVDHIGSGGMGEVYRAEDLRLQRPVALKFLSTEKVKEERFRARFALEARSASQIDHANICTIYDIDETDAGQMYIAMAFYEGETLLTRVTRGPLPLGEALGVACQVLQGLAVAHEHGIVHRDLKPANLIITARGEVKILDFGLARLRGEQRMTRIGVTVGTPAYMSPEQVYGRDVDARSDLWSVGVLLYEMATGMLPFDKSEEMALLHAIAHDTPTPLAGLPARELALLRPVVRRALAKEPDARYQSAGEMLDDLLALRRQLEGTGSGSPLVGPPSTPSLAVLPFADLSPDQDQEYFCVGMAEELVAALGRLPRLRVASRTSASHLLAQGLDVRSLGERLEVDSVLEGSVRRGGSRVRITAQLTEVGSGFTLWSGRFDRELDDVLAIQEEIAQTIVQTLEGKLDPAVEAALEKRPTASAEAYTCYLKGRYFWNRRTRDGIAKAVESFQRALDADPRFARAYAGLADSWLVLGMYGSEAPHGVMPRARGAALNALALDDGLAEAHTSVACVRAFYDWEWRGAEKGFNRAIQLDPGYATSRQWYAMNCLAPMGRFAEAEAQLRQALELDPLSPAVATSLGLLDFFRGRWPEAESQLAHTMEIEPGFAPAHLFLGQVLSAMGRHDEARERLARARELSGDGVDALAALAASEALAGRRGEALALLDELVARGRQRYVSATLLAEVHASLGDAAACHEELQRAHRERACDLVWVGLRPAFAALREGSSFRALLGSLDLPPATA